MAYSVASRSPFRHHRPTVGAIVRHAGAAVLLLTPVPSVMRGQDLPVLVRRTSVATVDPSTSTAAALLYLTNRGPRELQARLSVTDFISKTSGKGLNASSTFFGPGDKVGTAVLEVTLPPNGITQVRIEVANVWEAGESEADILANGTTIGTVRVLRYRLPFNVKVVAANPDKPDLAFVEGDSRQLVLRNDDAMTYVVRPALSVKDHTLEAPVVVLPPNSSRAVTLTPPERWFRGSRGILKEERVDGLLTLRFEPPGAASDPSWPARVIPFTAGLSSVSPAIQGILAFGLTFIVLSLGGACSLLLRYGLPNSLRRAAVRDRLTQLAERTRMLSVRTSSEIRVGLRVERQRLTQRLGSRKPFSPELPATLTEIDSRIDELMTHVQLVNDLNDLWKRVDMLYKTDEAPSKVSLVEDQVRSIADSLKRIPSTKQQLDANQAKIAEVISKIAELSNSDPVWEARLKSAFADLGVRRTDLTKGWPACDALFDMWGAKWEDIEPERFKLLDKRIAILELIQPNTKAPDDSKSGAGSDFSDALRSLDYPAARKAMREIQQGIPREDVVEALRTPDPSPWVSVAQTKVREFVPVHFSIRFPKRRMDDSEALDAIECEWDFGHDKFKEDGWRVTHYFPARSRSRKRKLWPTNFFHRGSESVEPNKSPPVAPHDTDTLEAENSDTPEANENSYTVKATFRYDGRRVMNENGEGAVEIPTPITVDPVPAVANDRTRVELAQLGIVLVVAMLGLIAGAREQLQKLDLVAAMIAVFLLGFSADSIKNALAPAKTEKES